MQRPFQVVRVADVTGCLRVAGGQEGLHLVEQGGLRDGVLRSGVQRAFVADDAGVVRVGQQRVERRLPERFGRALRRRHRGQPAGGQVAQQLRGRDFAGGVLLERPRDQPGGGASFRSVARSALWKP